jgi:hypothetical protein
MGADGEQSRIYSTIRSAIATAKTVGNEVFHWADRVVKLFEIGEWAYVAAEYMRENELLSFVQSFYA